MYDENAKERIMRCLKKNYEQFNVRIQKGLKAKYKAFAASRGMSLTEMITRYLDSEIEKSGFKYDPETASADE